MKLDVLLLLKFLKRLLQQVLRGHAVLLMDIVSDDDWLGLLEDQRLSLPHVYVGPRRGNCVILVLHPADQVLHIHAGIVVVGLDTRFEGLRNFPVYCAHLRLFEIKVLLEFLRTWWLEWVGGLLDAHIESTAVLLVDGKVLGLRIISQLLILPLNSLILKGRFDFLNVDDPICVLVGKHIISIRLLHPLRVVHKRACWRKDLKVLDLRRNVNVVWDQ